MSHEPEDRTIMVIVPNTLRDAINEKLDAAIADCPGAETERDSLFEQLLGYFNEHGRLPDFTITKKG